MFSACWRVICVGLLWLALIAPARAELLWGANGHPFTAYDGVGIDDQLGFLADLGLKSYRVNISDLSSAPALEALLAKAEPLGITILPVLTPSLSLDALSPEVLRARAYEFAFGLVSRFKGRIAVWELGNELEVHAIIRPCEMRDDGTRYPCEWGPAGGNGVLDYYGPRWAKASAVLKGLSEGATAADPAARKAMGTAGWGHVGAFERMRHDGIAWDISVWHLYGEDPEWAFKLLVNYGKPIWVTEMNHPRGSEPGEQQQADGMRRWMQRLAELAPRYNVEAAHIYELLDEPYWAPDVEAVMGLVRLERAGPSWKPAAPKPAYDAVREIVRGEGAPAIKRDCALDRMMDGRPAAEGQIAYLYCLLLARPADGQGLRDWAAQRALGTSLARLLGEMAGSKEFRSRYRTAFLSDARFVDLAYRLLLGRDPDSPGKAGYVAAVGEGRFTRPELITDIAASEEFKQRHRHLFQQS